MPSHLYDRIRASGAAAEKPAFIEPGGAVLTYGALHEGAARYAGALRALGVEPGERVAVQVEKSLAFVQLYLGCLRAGAVLLPLNTAYTLTEVDYFLTDATPRLFVCDPERRVAFEAAARRAGVAHIETLDARGEGSLADLARRQPPYFADAARGPDDLAGVLYTSGTTGRSKGAMISHANLASNAAALRDIWRFTSDDVLLHALPVYHTHGLFVAINVLLMAGGTTIFLPKFDPDDLIARMPQATCLMGVPTFYARLLSREGLGEAARAMRLFISGSAPLLAETHREWEARTGHRILERYGMTETNMIASNPYEGERRPGAVGFALPDVRLRVADPETGAPTPQGEIGMIEVGGPNVFRGYWRLPEKTASEFRADGCFITGDLGRIDADGYLHIVGRGKDLVISGGFNVYPVEVEAEIDALPGVVESAVIGAPHKDFGEGVAAVVVRGEGAAVDEAAILAALQDRLAKFKQPKKILFVEELPRNAMGKVQKNVLRDICKDIFSETA